MQNKVVHIELVKSSLSQSVPARTSDPGRLVAAGIDRLSIFGRKDCGIGRSAAGNPHGFFFLVQKNYTRTRNPLL